MREIVKFIDPLMGTETLDLFSCECLSCLTPVKFIDPLMGTETVKKLALQIQINLGLLNLLIP